MLGYILRRLGLMLVVILGVTLATFLLMRLAPGDPAETIAYARYGMDGITPDVVSRVREQEGLDGPILVEYGKWLAHLLQGDLGRSLVTYLPVKDEILSKLPATFELAASSILLALAVSLTCGTLAAARANSVFDHYISLSSLIGYAMPSFWLGLVLILIFSVWLGWLPVFGRGGPQSLILPTLTMASGLIAFNIKLTRSSMLEVLGRNYIRTAYAKGLSEWRVLTKHALKNTLIPIVTTTGMQFAFFMEGSAVVESVFSWPGVGKLLVDAITNRDFPIIQGCALTAAVIIVLVNLLVDISYAYLDPRIRYGSTNRL